MKEVNERHHGANNVFIIDEEVRGGHRLQSCGARPWPLVLEIGVAFVAAYFLSFND